MAEAYTHGRWIVKPGEEEAFAEEWSAFASWASGFDGSGTFRLVRDVGRSNHYMSFAPWESSDAQNAWKQHSEFRERIGRVRSHCEDFQPSVFELVTTVE
jgi:heme-degrading monooxygenase HmoA